MEAHKIKNMDDIFILLGNPGRFQVIQCMVLGFQYLHLSLNDFIPIFYGLQPSKVRCKDNVNSSVPLSTFTQTNASTESTGGNGTSVFCNCSGRFDYVYPDKEWSIIGDMDLVCDKAWLVNLSTTVYFLGQLSASPVCGWAADRFGRRPVLLTCSLLYTSVATGLIFSRDYNSFVILRFFTGVAVQGIVSSFFVLLMEWVSPDSRRKSWAAMVELSFTGGVMVLALAAYLLPNWHHLQGFLAALNVVSVLLIWFCPESLSWLCLSNRPDQVITNCQLVAKFNGVTLSDSTIQNIRNFVEMSADKDHSSKHYSFIDCFRTHYMRKTTLLCCFNWFACYFCYIGLSYLSSEVAMNVYLNLGVNGALELLPAMFAAAIASRFGNKRPLVLYFLGGGVASLIAGTIPGTTYAQMIGQNAMAFLGRTLLVGTCCVIFVFQSELFPTTIRNNGYNLCSVALHVGSMVTPFLPLMSEQTSYKGSGFLAVGVVSVLSAIAAVFLRETVGQPLPETWEDVETSKKGSTCSVTLDYRGRRNENRPSNIGLQLRRRSTVSGRIAHRQLCEITEYGIKTIITTTGSENL